MTATKGVIATDTLTRALLDLAARGERTHCSDPGTSELWISESEKPVCVDELGPGARGAIPKIRFFAALSLLLAVLQVTGSSGLAKVGRGTGALAPVSRSIPILPRLQKEQT